MNFRIYLTQTKLTLQLKFDDYKKGENLPTCTLLTLDLDQELWMLKEHYNIVSHKINREQASSVVQHNTYLPLIHHIFKEHFFKEIFTSYDNTYNEDIELKDLIWLKEYVKPMAL
jgi:hypothetical protein